MSNLSITQQPEILPQLRRESIRRIVEQGQRADGRSHLDFRNIDIIVNPVKTADGSAIVKLGNTVVIAGVKTSIGAPYPDTPDEGALIVNLETPPLASPEIEPGPPDENAIEIARVVDRTIRHSGFIDFKSLCIVPGKHVYILWVDIYVLNHDGNVIDAACMAAVSALSATKLPKAVIEQDQARLVREERIELKVDRSKLPLTITFVKICNSLLVDPTLEEENVSDAKITIGVSEDKIVSIQKTTGSFDREDIASIISKSVELYSKLRNVVLSKISSESYSYIRI